MNKSNLKSYAPQARRDFIAAITSRAHLLGLTASASGVEAAPAELKSDVLMIAGRPWPARISEQRNRLIQRMQRIGFAQTIEAVAYAWFNRLVALRYMELHDYLGHGRRVLSNPAGGLPEALSFALELVEANALPGLLAEKVRELKLGNQDAELYRSILIAQCNALNQAMPFLFEPVADATELLLPDNLLLSDSIVAKLVAKIPEDDWAEVEAIGWLYQFYISEKKDEVIGNVVKSEDIPAATQLFTPNWIVQYLVQNSVGRLWLMANPTSMLASQWPYYIQPTEQKPEVQAQLDALIQTRIREDGEALNPETITVLDPACGSGHILVVAYDVLKAIYLERGYQPRTIPRLILEKNLFGLDIDDRAAQLAGFALLMKARADDRRLFNEPPKLNILSIQDGKGLNADELATHLVSSALQQSHLRPLVDTFQDAKSVGSLTNIPPELNGKLPEMAESIQKAVRAGDLYARQAGQALLPMLLQAQILARKFDIVVMNPPYMGSKGINPQLKAFALKHYPDSKSDLFAMFMERSFGWCKPSGFSSMVTMQSWMFLSSYESLRKRLIAQRTVSTFLRIGYNSFPEMNSKIAQACAFVFHAKPTRHFVAKYIDLNFAPQSADKRHVFLQRTASLVYELDQARFREIAGSPLAFWASDKVRANFSEYKRLDEYASPAVGLNTGNNERFLRLWHEVCQSRVEYDCVSLADTFSEEKKWYPYNKGGEYKRWYGNNFFLINWSNDGEEIKQLAVKRNAGKHWSRYIQNLHWMLKPGITWSATSSLHFGARKTDSGFFFDVKGSSAFTNENQICVLLGFLNSKLVGYYLQLLNPTVEFQTGDLRRLPISNRIIEDCCMRAELEENVQNCIAIARDNWNSFETSWGFSGLPWSATECNEGCKLETSWRAWSEACAASERRLKEIEESSNLLLIDAYGLRDELTQEVPEDQITLVHAHRQKDSQRLISYAIGCIMGRYSLDEPGLIFARAGNVGFERSRYEKKFPADADGIVPITDVRWFDDDAAGRLNEFLRVLWGGDTLEENLAWLAESLGAKGSEAPDETIRRYLADNFFKEHLQTYKKRPIYWLFSSGKQGAFQALVYLHRYHAGTLSRMRSEYVIPLTGKLQARIDTLEKDALAASSTAARNRLGKQRDALRRKHRELLSYDEQLRHYADQRIEMDLDHGVKVNYGKFGPLLAEVKTVTGGKEEE